MSLASECPLLLGSLLGSEDPPVFPLTLLSIELTLDRRSPADLRLAAAGIFLGIFLAMLLFVCSRTGSAGGHRTSPSFFGNSIARYYLPAALPRQRRLSFALCSPFSSFLHRSRPRQLVSVQSFPVFRRN